MGRRVVSRCKWYANDNTAYSEKNVIFFYKQKIPISPFVQSPLTFFFLLTVYIPRLIAHFFT